MKNTIIGRKAEQAILEEAIESKKAELISVIGRRRVGKTYLIETFFKNRLVFQISGIQNASLPIQLRNFNAQLNTYLRQYNLSPVAAKNPADWFEAILQLINYLESIDQAEKKVVFFDELPWLDTRRSNFLQAFSYFWNSWAKNKNIIVVICGSAAAWMIKKVVHHKGGLHNRITRQLQLAPFTLRETEQYFQAKNMYFERYHILQLYMVMGGIPHYLEAIRPGMSATQNIEQLCFSSTGLLHNEFSKLYASLFKNEQVHIAIIRALATSKKGLTRNKIIALSKLKDGGTFKKTLEELIFSGFITAYRPFGKKKKEKLFRLTDAYSLFYLQFIEKNDPEEGIWQQLSQTQTYKIWSGYAFENVCLQHIPSIKKALGISGIYATTSSFYRKGTANSPGVQIGLLIDRNDQTVNLFEIKFYNETITLTKKQADQLRERMGAFRHATQTRKQLFWVFLSAFGLKDNAYSNGVVAKSLTMDELF